MLYFHEASRDITVILHISESSQILRRANISSPCYERSSELPFYNASRMKHVKRLLLAGSITTILAVLIWLSYTACPNPNFRCKAILYAVVFFFLSGSFHIRKFELFQIWINLELVTVIACPLFYTSRKAKLQRF